MAVRRRGGRPRGPIRAACEEARELALFLRELVDRSAKTYRELEEEIYCSRTRISEVLSGKVPDPDFVIALVAATVAETPDRERDEKQALALLAAADRSLREDAEPTDTPAQPPAATGTPTLFLQAPLPQMAPGSVDPGLLQLLAHRMELEREVAALKNERKRLKREKKHTRELNEVRELLARAEAARDQAEIDAQQSLEKRREAEKAAARARDRARRLTVQLSRRALSEVVPDSTVDEERERGSAAGKSPSRDADNSRTDADKPDPEAVASTAPSSGCDIRSAPGQEASVRAPSGQDGLQGTWAEASAAADAFRADDAVRLYGQLVQAQERLAGPDHPHTLTARHNLAAWQGEAGDAAGAVAALSDLLPHRERVLGPDHPDTLATRHNLAHWQGSAGDAQAAVAGLAALLPDALRVLGADHPDTLTLRHNLAVWRGEAGDAAGAVTALSDLLSYRERVLGAGHPDTLATRSDLAQWRGVSGDTGAAVSDFAALLPDVQQALGANHLYTLIVRHNLAAWQGVSGDRSGAAAALSQLLPETFQALGGGHTHTHVIRTQLNFWRGKVEP